MKRPAAKGPVKRSKAATVMARPARNQKLARSERPTSGSDESAEAASFNAAEEAATVATNALADMVPVADELVGGTSSDDVVASPPDLSREATPDERVLIEIDPSISAGFINNRYDVEVRGWVVASSPVEEVALWHAGAVASRVQYGPPGATSRITLPDGTIVTRHVFTLLLPRTRAEAGGACDIAIGVRTASGQTHQQDFALAIDPLLPTQVRVQSGPTRPSADYAGELTPVVLFIERASVDPAGYLQLVGWAVSMATLVTIQVFAGDERVSSPRLGTRRDDVANAFPSYPNALHAGFMLSTPLNEQAQSASVVRAQAICADGFAHEIVVPLERVARAIPPPQPAHRPPPAPPSLPAPGEVALPRQDPLYRLVTGFSLSPDVLAAASLGTPTPSLAVPPAAAPVASIAPQKESDQRRIIYHFCDISTISDGGEVVVDGWAVCAIGIAVIEVWLDDQRLGEAEVGLPRDDVGEQYRNIPMSRHSGFRFVIHVPLPSEGEHRLRVVFRNGLDDTEEELSSHFVDRPKPPPVIEAPAEFRFEIDTPSLSNGIVIEPITGRLTIEGWVLSRSGIAEMLIWLDDQRLGEAHYGLARQDVGNAFPDWPNSLRSGYAFHCPPRSLRNGEHIVKITVRAVNGEEMQRSFSIDVRKPEGSDEMVSIRRRMPLVEVDVLTEALDKLDCHPSFQLVLRQNGPIEPMLLARTFTSLRSQVYHDWRLTAWAEDAESAAEIRTCLADQPTDLADRVTVIDASGTDGNGLDTPFGANDESTSTLLFGLLCPGDELGCDALMELALAAGQWRTADFLYADEIRLSPASREREPFCKPDFSPDLLLSTNYIGRPWFAGRALLARAEVTPRALLRDAEYDIVLRCTEQASAVRHVPRVLCRRGADMLDSDNAARAALRRAAVRRGVQADVQPTTVPGTFRFRRRKRATGKVSIIIPTCAAHGHIETCIRTLRDQTAYRNFEIICVDNIPAHQVGWKRWLRDNADKVVDIPEAFNWSRFNNKAAEHAEGEYLLFLNDDVEVINAEWLDALLEHVQQPDVGIAGARLLYPGGKVQHAGMFLSTIGIARHAFRFAADDEPGYFGLALTQRNVLAVTGACLLVRREAFDAIGQFDEAHEVVNNDLDFCLRMHQAGLRTVYTPYAKLIHHELASRDQVKETFDTSHFERQWKSLFTAGDPYFSPLLSRHADDYRPDDEPVESVFAGHPMFRRDEIKRVLVVKLDHIGDFITALPAIRRLKHHFPNATIHVLAARGARAFAEAETCIDGFIEFEFFHARSGLGQKDLTEEDYAALRARLVPYGFDLAIDLRKHPDTREALRHVPARFLAGFDYMGQFTFLDVALEWEGDKNLHRKRTHVTDDLINLVEAVGTAASQDRNSLVSPTWPATTLPIFLAASVRRLFEKPVVAVHPGVGTVMRQWPAEHFAALIDLLIATSGVNAVIVGGPDEVELAQEVLEKVVHKDAVESLTGRTSLAELTEVLASCALYVGNNSGPKHIAAAIGVPTIGVHSGVIDPTEWAPIGQRAMALRRNMNCSPCYLARLEDCPRNLACLRQLEPASVWQACEALLAISRGVIVVTAPDVTVAEPARVEAENLGPQVEPSTPAASIQTRGHRRKRGRAASQTDTAGAEAAVAETAVAEIVPVEPDTEQAPAQQEAVETAPSPTEPEVTTMQDRPDTPLAIDDFNVPTRGRRRRRDVMADQVAIAATETTVGDVASEEAPDAPDITSAELPSIEPEITRPRAQRSKVPSSDDTKRSSGDATKSKSRRERLTRASRRA